MLQANLRRGSADARALVDQVVRNRVDILATEELSLDERDRLVAAGLSAALPYRVDAARGHGEGGAGIALWSRFPLTDEHVLPGFALGAVSGVIRAGGVPVTVVAVHLVAPFPNPAGQWAAECRRLSALLGTETSGPLVVGGDFNATPDNAQFRQLLTGPLRDAAEEDGAGYVSTYPADRWFPPLIAIDHVLVAHAQAGQVATVALPGSDHRGLRVRIRIGD